MIRALTPVTFCAYSDRAMTNPLKAWRGRRTQDEAGELLGVDAMTLSRWERGVHLPRKKHWAKIEEVTGITPSTLVEHMKAELTQ
jgi:transcriptional regulator with XRE-family HTH domain